MLCFETGIICSAAFPTLKFFSNVGEFDATRFSTQLTSAAPSGVHVNATNRQGYSSLHVAALHGHVALVELLLLRGADPALRTDTHRATPLHLAAQNNKQFTHKVTRNFAEVGFFSHTDSLIPFLWWRVVRIENATTSAKTYHPEQLAGSEAESNSSREERVRFWFACPPCLKRIVSWWFSPGCAVPGGLRRRNGRDRFDGQHGVALLLSKRQQRHRARSPPGR